MSCPLEPIIEPIRDTSTPAVYFGDALSLMLISQLEPSITDAEERDLRCQTYYEHLQLIKETIGLLEKAIQEDPMFKMFKGYETTETPLTSQTSFNRLIIDDLNYCLNQQNKAKRYKNIYDQLVRELGEGSIGSLSAGIVRFIPGAKKADLDRELAKITGKSPVFVAECCMIISDLLVSEENFDQGKISTAGMDLLRTKQRALSRSFRDQPVYDIAGNHLVEGLVDLKRLISRTTDPEQRELYEVKLASLTRYSEALNELLTENELLNSVVSLVLGVVSADDRSCYPGEAELPIRFTDVCGEPSLRRSRDQSGSRAELTARDAMERVIDKIRLPKTEKDRCHLRYLTNVKLDFIPYGTVGVKQEIDGMVIMTIETVIDRRSYLINYLIKLVEVKGDIALLLGLSHGATSDSTKLFAAARMMAEEPMLELVESEPGVWQMVKQYTQKDSAIDTIRLTQWSTISTFYQRGLFDTSDAAQKLPPGGARDQLIEAYRTGQDAYCVNVIYLCCPGRETKYTSERLPLIGATKIAMIPNYLQVKPAIGRYLTARARELHPEASRLYLSLMGEIDQTRAALADEDLMVFKNLMASLIDPDVKFQGISGKAGNRSLKYKARLEKVNQALVARIKVMREQLVALYGICQQVFYRSAIADHLQTRNYLYYGSNGTPNSHSHVYLLDCTGCRK